MLGLVPLVPSGSLRLAAPRAAAPLRGARLVLLCLLCTVSSALPLAAQPVPVAASTTLRPSAVETEDKQAAKARAAFENETKALRRRFKRLSKAERLEWREWYEAELRYTDTFQLKLLRFVLGGQDVDPGTWPDADDPPIFDPKEHAPGAARRKVLKERSSKVKKVRKAFLSKVPERALQSSWAYDYGTGGLVRLGDPRDPETVFENGLVGFAPDHDLVEALIERMLDDASQRVPLRAFGHAYTDRNGGVYPGLTLYDGWASGTTLEMPDVDCLGVIHYVLDDWDTWSAPVPARQQDPLYERIGEIFVDAYRHRALRHALARTFLGGSVALRDGYALELDRLHALWEEKQSTPSELRAMLPTAETWFDFIDEWGRLTDKHPKKLAAGVNRRAALDQGHGVVRSTLVRVLEQLETQIAEREAEAKAAKKKAKAGG